MKKMIAFLILIGILAVTYFYKDTIVTYISTEYMYKYANVKQKANGYKKNLDISFVKETNNFFPQSKQDILNIIYTSLNNGVDSFIYYCTDAYKDCIAESERLAKNESLLSNINTFIHPFNSYSRLSFSMNSLGKVEITVHKQYSDEEIAVITKKVDEIYGNIIKENMSIHEKIRTIHDYIGQNSYYDKEKADSIVNGVVTKEGPYKSETAYGVLLQGYGICNGFSDAMELFLTKMGVTSYKIANETHMWNLIYTDNTWKHLDLTWDNPITNGSQKFLFHDFFLVDSKTLKNLDTGHHIFDETIYKEAL